MATFPPLAFAAASVLLGTGAIASETFTTPNLTNGDFAAMRIVAPRLYKTDDAVAGNSETWTNPKNGHHGTITVVSLSEHNGVPCRLVKYDTIIPSQGPSSYLLTWCKSSNAAGWKVS